MNINALKLKVKAKSLAEEAKIIRKEEIRIKNMKYFDEATQNERRRALYQLGSHRIWDVRNEARATHLARAYLRGKKYSNTEGNVSVEGHMNLRIYILKRVLTMVQKYGDRKTTEAQVKEWLEIN